MKLGFDLAKQEFEQAKATSELKEHTEGISEQNKSEFAKIIDSLEKENAKITKKFKSLTKFSESLYKPDTHNKSYIDNINTEIDTLRIQMEANIKAQLEKESLILSQSKLNSMNSTML